MSVFALSSNGFPELGSDATADVADVLGGHRGPCLVDSTLHGAPVATSDTRGIGGETPLGIIVVSFRYGLRGGQRFLSKHLRLGSSHSWAILEV